MKTFNSIKEIQKYYNENTTTYEFVEDGKLLDVKFAFDLDIESHIKAGDIKARNIDALNITAGNITAMNIDAWDINA